MHPKKVFRSLRVIKIHSRTVKERLGINPVSIRLRNLTLIRLQVSRQECKTKHKKTCFSPGEIQSQSYIENRTIYS